MFRPILIGTMLFGAAPVLAQSTTAAQSRSDAIAAQTAPGVADANRSIAAQARMQSGAVTAVNAAQDARYRADVQRYRAAMRARRHVIASDSALQNDRERAYAMAMADWRAQVRACERGRSRACKRPSPNPQDYM